MIANDEWLVVIDRQKVFAESDWSDWACPDGSFHDTDAAYERLVNAFGDRVVHTRYVAPAEVRDAWVAYFQDWPQFLVPADDPMYDLTEDTAAFAEGHPIVTCDTFGKWGEDLARAIEGSKRITVCGVATDCCVLNTVLAAADAGVSVQVAADACAGSSPENHQRALDVMAGFAPIVSVRSTDEILG